MTLDEKIHFVLDKMNGSRPVYLPTEINVWLQTVKESADDLEVFLIINALLFERYIIFERDSNGHVITHLGRSINESGGWKAFILSKKNKADIENKTAENNLHISDFQVKTQWWPHRLSILAVVISVFSLGVSVRQCQQGQSTQPKTESVTQDQRSDSTTQPTTDSLKTVSADSSQTN